MKTKFGLVVLIVAGVLLSVAFTSAQQPQPPPPENDPLGEFVFPPELVMQHQREIGDRKSTRLNSSHIQKSRMPSSA